MKTLYDTVKSCKNQADLHNQDIRYFDDLFDAFGGKEAIKIIHFINQCYNVDSEYQVYANDWRTFLMFRAKECNISQEIINNITEIVGISSKELIMAIDGYLNAQSDEEFSLLASKRTLQANMMQRMINCTDDVTDLKIANEITNKTLEDIKNLEESIRARKQQISNGKAMQHLSAAKGRLNISNFVNASGVSN